MNAVREELPLVTVVISSYNHINYVEQAIQSVLASNYKKIEIIVVDDCSHDGSQEKLEELSRKMGFQLILNEENLGLNQSLQKTMSLWNGKYVAFLASDDFIGADKISLQVAYLEGTVKDAVYSNAFLVNANGVVQGEGSLSLFEEYYSKGKALELIYIDDSSSPLLQSGLFKTKIMKELFWVRKMFMSDDWAIQIKLFEKYDIGFVNNAVVYYRLHENNTHRNYWKTLSWRVDIISNLTPGELRLRALSNLFLSVGSNAFRSRDYYFAIRFTLLSLVIGFPLLKIKKIFKKFNFS